MGIRTPPMQYPIRYNLVVLATLFDSFNADIARAYIQYTKLCTSIIWKPPRFVRCIANNWQDQDLGDPSMFEKEENIPFSAGFTSDWLKARGIYLEGNMAAWKDVLQLSHLTSLLIECMRRELGRDTNDCCLSRNNMAMEAILGLIIGNIRNFVERDIVNSLEGMSLVSPNSQSARIINQAISGCISTWGEIERVWASTGSTALAHSQLFNEEQMGFISKFIQDSMGKGKKDISGQNVDAPTSLVDQSTVVFALGERTVKSPLSDWHISSATSTSSSASIMDSQESLVCQSMTSDLTNSETLKVLGSEIECLSNSDTFEGEYQELEEEVDKYWTWDTEIQKYVHLDEDTGEMIYHPDEFD